MAGAEWARETVVGEELRKVMGRQMTQVLKRIWTFTPSEMEAIKGPSTEKLDDLT